MAGSRALVAGSDDGVSHREELEADRCAKTIGAMPSIDLQSWDETPLIPKATGYRLPAIGSEELHLIRRLLRLGLLGALGALPFRFEENLRQLGKILFDGAA